MAGGRTQTGTRRKAGLALALLACLGLLLQGVLRLTHHHDGATAHAAHIDAGDHGVTDHGHNDHGEKHGDVECALCQALAAASSALLHATAPVALAPIETRQRAGIQFYRLGKPARAAPWLSRAPPIA
jgi:hypothetical protein